jgi:hypothetical protein
MDILVWILKGQTWWLQCILEVWWRFRHDGPCWGWCRCASLCVNNCQLVIIVVVITVIVMFSFCSGRVLVLIISPPEVVVQCQLLKTYRSLYLKLHIMDAAQLRGLVASPRFSKALLACIFLLSIIIVTCLFLRRSQQTAVPIWVLNVHLLCFWYSWDRAGCLYCSLQLEDMHNCFGRMSHASPVGSSILRNGGMGWHLDAKAGKCMMDFSFPKQINCSYWNGWVGQK